jgi:hypothetical protein
MWLRHKQQNRTSPRVRQRHRGDRIRWSPDSYSGCSFTEYIPKASDGYLLPQLGTYSENWDFLETGYIKAGVNGTSGDHQGALGNYGNAGQGIMYDPTGNGNFNQYKDWLAYGVPWEGWSFTQKDVMGNNSTTGATIGGGNSDSPSILANVNIDTVMYTVEQSRHYVIVAGHTTASQTGVAVIQYKTEADSHGICIHQLWLNTTGSAKHMYSMRGTDPDADNNNNGNGSNAVSDTYNVFGWDTIDAEDIVVSYAERANQIMALRTSGNGYDHKVHIAGSWPDYNGQYHMNMAQYYPIPISASNPNNPYGRAADYSDSAIIAAWDLGTVAAGSYAAVSCAYIFGKGVDEAETVADFGNTE